MARHTRAQSNTTHASVHCTLLRAQPCNVQVTSHKSSGKGPPRWAAARARALEAPVQCANTRLQVTMAASTQPTWEPVTAPSVTSALRIRCVSPRPSGVTGSPINAGRGATSGWAPSTMQPRMPTRLGAAAPAAPLRVKVQMEVKPTRSRAFAAQARVEVTHAHQASSLTLMLTPPPNLTRPDPSTSSEP